MAIMCLCIVIRSIAFEGAKLSLIASGRGKNYFLLRNPNRRSFSVPANCQKTRTTQPRRGIVFNAAEKWKIALILSRNTNLRANGC
jgi:hypothetical protein